MPRVNISEQRASMSGTGIISSSKQLVRSATSFIAPVLFKEIVVPLVKRKIGLGLHPAGRGTRVSGKGLRLAGKGPRPAGRGLRLAGRPSGRN